MIINDIEDEKSEIEYELDQLKDENLDMLRFFGRLGVPIIKKAILKIEKQLRRFPPEARQFDDDSTLNSFEEVCVMIQEGSMDYSMFVEDTIERCCESVYNDLNSDEKFIINHQLTSSEQNGP